MADGSTRGGFAALDPCVHCGFCLSACPTYLATGDESSSPRGRIVLMRALERGELLPGDAGLRQHLDACLGCRGCEPACPSGVGYGRGLEEARLRLAEANGVPIATRAILALFARTWRWRAFFAVGRWLRETGIPAVLARLGRPTFVLGMLDATRPLRPPGPKAAAVRRSEPGGGESVALFRGCVMDGLFEHVHQATRRTLEANGYRVVEVERQHCCGALHEHAGDRAGACELARANVSAFAGVDADWIVVDSAGCGALLKDYGHLLDGPAGALAARVRDVSELLAARGPRPGAPLSLEVCYDGPCHLQHAQRVQEQPLRVLRAIPGLRLRLLPGSDRCCGGAGIHGALHPELSRTILSQKLATFRDAVPRPEIIATGNPGCLMQIGAGILAEGLDLRVAHPVELLDWSYQEAGLYG